MRKVISLLMVFGFVLSCAFVFTGCSRPEAEVKTLPKDGHYPVEMHDLIYPTPEYDMETLAKTSEALPAQASGRPDPQRNPHRGQSWYRDSCGCCGHVPWTDSWCEVHRKPGYPNTYFTPNRYTWTAEWNERILSDMRKLNESNELIENGFFKE